MFFGLVALFVNVDNRACSVKESRKNVFSPESSYT